MTVRGHAVRIRTPMQSPALPIRWVVTTWCGRELQGVQGAPGAQARSVSCAECQEALKGSQAA